MTDIHLTKLAAARRQLCAAIRMYFAGEDELAVHTVASAAYRIIVDLKSSRGRDEVGDYYLTMTFYAVQNFHRGTIPRYLADDPESMRWVQELAEQLPITATSEYEDVKASVSPEVAKEFWRKRNKVFNFLKHADRDADKYISMDEVDNLFLLVLAQSSYLDIDKEGLSNEGLVLSIYFHVDSGNIDSLTKDEHVIVSYLESLTKDERLQFCSEWLKELNEGDEEDN